MIFNNNEFRFRLIRFIYNNFLINHFDIYKYYEIFV